MIGAQIVRSVFLFALILCACAGGDDNLLDHCEYVRELTVTDTHGLQLWRVKATAPTKTCTIKYSQTPAHFIQITPHEGSARTFATLNPNTLSSSAAWVMAPSMLARVLFSTSTASM